jgi:ribulose-5-phosphate 4-epimerase/fuculose-1-phosphate aldolase
VNPAPSPSELRQTLVIANRIAHREGLYEFWIHAGIHAARSDVNAVVRAHPPYCAAIASVGQTVRPLTITGALFTHPIPVFERFGLIDTAEVGQDVATCLGPTAPCSCAGTAPT